MPARRSQRVAAIDAVRGVALFGVLSVNLVTEFRVSVFAQFLPTAVLSGAMDRWAEAFVTYGLESKAFALFSMLFGVGLAIQYERLRPTGVPLRWLARRLLVLLGLGLIHLYFVWDGDILTEYALAGFVALPLLRAPSWLLRTACAGLFVLYGLLPLLPPPVPWPGAAQLASHVALANRVLAHGSYPDVLRFNIAEVTLLLPLHVYVYPRTVALFLLGVLTWRSGLLSRPAAHRRSLGVLALAGLCLGGVATYADARGLLPAGAHTAWLGVLLSQLAPVVVAVGYGASLLYAWNYTGGGPALGVFAPLGRMALTNYVLQSVICGWLYFGYGAGWHNELGVAATLGVGCCIYAAQLLASHWWLRRYRFGPIEWAWRTLTYGAVQPLRLHGAARLP